MKKHINVFDEYGELYGKKTTKSSKTKEIKALDQKIKKQIEKKEIVVKKKRLFDFEQKKDKSVITKDDKRQAYEDAPAFFKRFVKPNGRPKEEAVEIRQKFMECLDEVREEIDEHKSRVHFPMLVEKSLSHLSDEDKMMVVELVHHFSTNNTRHNHFGKEDDD